MITTIIMVLAALFGAWLLSRTQCINTRFLAPPRGLFTRIFARKTRRGWENVAFNAEEEPTGELSLEESKAMNCELLDLDHNADDDEIRARFKEYGQEGATAENAKREERRKVASNALGLGDDATLEDIHAEIVKLPETLKKLKDTAANARKDAIKASIDLAIAEGKVLAHQREVYEAAFNSDYPGTLAKLAKAEKQLNTERLNMNGRKQDTAANAELGAQVQEAALAYQEKHGGAEKCPWSTAWNAQKKVAKFKPYFEKTTTEVAS